MAVTAKLEPIEDFIRISVDRMLSPAARSKAIADFAKERLAEAQDANARSLGRVPEHETFVDGRAGAAPESVRPDAGTIVFEFELIDELMAWIGQTLIERSPRRSGDYLAGHRLLADGEVVEPGTPLPAAAEYAFVNTVPYARKIEVGKTKDGRDFVIQVENRIYERTADDARRRFGNIAQIRFSYRSPLLDYVAIGRKEVPGAAKRSAASIERITRVPAIVVTLR